MPADRLRGYAQDGHLHNQQGNRGDFLRDRLRLGELHIPARRMIARLLQSANVACAGMVMARSAHRHRGRSDSVLIDEQ
jgi:hypothetical protein